MTSIEGGARLEMAEIVVEIGYDGIEPLTSADFK
jgi:hypothetical protein